MLKSCQRFFHTIRYLRFKQIFWRLYYKIIKIQLVEREGYEQRIWSSSGFGVGQHPSSMPTLDSFEFLGEQDFVKDPEAWNDPHKSKLWLYNLHYFDDLNAMDAEARYEAHKDLINRWILENPPLFGNGWESYPLSIRIVNWVKWFSRAKHIKFLWLKSLSLQAQALYKQLEFHILGNHLWTNAKALVFAGAFLRGKESQKWFNKGIQLLAQEIQEQFLIDGGHFELSPMYHSILLQDLVDLIELAKLSKLSELQERVFLWSEAFRKGLIWLKNMSLPDGSIAFFNDAALGIAPCFEANFPPRKKKPEY